MATIKRLDKKEIAETSITNSCLLRDKFNYLVDRYGAELGLPARGERQFIVVFARKSGLALGTVRNIQDGRISSVKEKTAHRLFELFRTAMPLIEAHWFNDLSLQEFVKRVESAPRNKKLVTLSLPAAGWKNFDRLRRWACGVYVCYRYGFERNDQRLVAREILHVWETDELLQFRMSFVPGGDEVGQVTGFFDGVVFPLGESLFFVAWNDDRGRSLFLHTDYSSEARDCRIGILSSTRLSSNRAPLAACTVMIKCGTPPSDIQRFMCEATKSASFESMVDQNFGGKLAREWIAKFLYNGPHAHADGYTTSDTVLRIDLYRFSTEMPTIYRAALGNSNINAPFKPDWKPCHKPGRC
jgi:hypothetical protein